VISAIREKENRRLSQKPRETQTKPQNKMKGSPFRVFVRVISAIREKENRV
jgi:hypothetical protein